MLSIVPLFLVFLPSSSLLIYSNGSFNSIPSVFATLGVALQTDTLFPDISSLSSTDISDDCAVYKNVTDKVAVYTGTVPALRGCCRDTFGSSTALVRTLQLHGAIAVVMEATEEV
jgi:hypothetical protein